MTLTYEPDPQSVKLNKHTKYVPGTSKIIYFNVFVWTYRHTHIYRLLYLNHETEQQKVLVPPPRPVKNDSRWPRNIISLWWYPFPDFRPQNLNPTNDSELNKMLAKSNMHSYIKTWNLWYHKKFSMRSEQTNIRCFPGVPGLASPAKTSEFVYRRRIWRPTNTNTSSKASTGKESNRTHCINIKRNTKSRRNAYK